MRPARAKGHPAKAVKGNKFENIAARASDLAGSFWAFSIAFLTIVVWGATGPIFHYSNTWQLVINTGTTIVTFLMVFLIQHASNKDMRAVQLKLNELLAATEGASNRLIDVEELSDHEIANLHMRFRTLTEEAQRFDVGAKTSVDVAKQAKEPILRKPVTSR